MLKNRKGLSLPELLAVVVIMGIIAAIAIPAVSTIIDNSKKDAHVANALRLIEAAELYEANNGTITVGHMLDANDIGAYISGLNTSYITDTDSDPATSEYTAGTNSDYIPSAPVTNGGYVLYKTASGWAIAVLNIDTDPTATVTGVSVFFSGVLSGGTPTGLVDGTDSADGVAPTNLITKEMLQDAKTARDYVNPNSI